jgi:hypothetical protein
LGGAAQLLSLGHIERMTQAEFRDIDRKMYRRQVRRQLLAIPLLVFIFGALSLVPRSSPHRDLYIWSIIIVAGIYLVFFLRLVFRGLKADSQKFGAICPKCGQSLYSGQGVRNGCCPNCDYKIIDNVVA